MVNLVFCIAFMLTAYIITIFIYKKRYNTNNLKQNIMLFVIYLSVGIAIGVLYKIYAFDILKTFKALAIISITLITAGIDYREKIIPNEAVVCIIAVACVMMIINAFTNSVEALAIFIDSLVAMLIGVVLFAASKAISKNGGGMGDIKLVGALGLYLRTYALMGVLLVALVSIAIYGLIKVISKKACVKDEIPFGPFVAFGVTACMILGF